MGFPVGQAEYLLPKLLVKIADFINYILRLIAWVFSSVGLGDLLLNSTSTTTTFQTTISWHTHRGQYIPKSKSRQVLVQNAIPAVKYADSHGGTTDGGTCAVCLQEFAATDDVGKLSNCRHVFHKCCIDPWVELERTTCPLCRTPFVLEDTQDYIDGNSSATPPLPTVSYYYYDEDYDGHSHYEAYLNDHGVGTSGMNPVDNCAEYDMPYWPLETCPQPGSGFQFFDTDVTPDAMSNVLPDSLGCQTVGGYESTPNGGQENSLFMEDIPTCHGTEINGSLVDNKLAFVNDDPSLQIFLPTRHADVSMQVVNNENADVSNGIKTDDWISLRLGGAGPSQGQLSTTDGLVHGHQVPSGRGRSESLVDPDSLHLAMNDDRSNKNVNLNAKQFDGTFSHPRQPRSVRPRLLLSIDTDSDSDS